MQKIADKELKRRQSIIEMEEIKKKEIIDKYTTEKKKLKQRKQGIGHIQSSMQNLISRLEEGRNLMAPISSSSDSGDSIAIDINPSNIVIEDLENSQKTDVEETNSSDEEKSE